VTAPRGIDRRALLLRGGLLVGASSLAGATGFVAGREVGESDGAPDASDTNRFELDPEYVNLATFLLASHPRIVREAIERHRRELDANPALYLSQSERALGDAARAAAAAYLGTEPEQVALTDSTTMGLGLVYARLRLEPGDEVVTTEPSSMRLTRRSGYAKRSTA
jgi:isopenicillin-N epimerase